HKGKCAGIERGDAVKQRIQRARAAKGHQQTKSQPDYDKLETLADDQPQNITSLRTESHAHTNFVCSLHDEIRHDSVNSDRSEQKSNARENAKQNNGKTARRD